MARKIVQIKSCLAKEYADFKPAKLPKRWGETGWQPSVFLRSKARKKYLAVGIELSGRIPISLYRESVVPLKKAHEDLVVVVCVTDGGLLQFPETEEECQEMGLGLKVLEPGLGLATVVATDLDPQNTVALDQEAGYFPDAILDRAKGLKRLMFQSTIDRFITQIRRIQKDEASKIKERTLSVVCEAIDELLRHHPSFRGTMKEFMKLVHFEELLQTRAPGSSDHVIHAFRVFLAGCPVVNQFYSDFTRAHRYYMAGCQQVRVEYAWLLSSIFHDIGRPKEGMEVYAKAVVQDELQDDDLLVHIEGNPNRWVKPGYKDALRVLGSLAAYLGDNRRDKWDGGGFRDEDGEKLEEEWIRTYDELKWHGVIGAIDYLRLICDNAKAADERRSRPFVLAHAVPAALAILLHDWRVHNDARKWGLFPIRTQRLPLAALLHYVDTWDDYKRKGDNSAVSILDYQIKKRESRVKVEWADEKLFRNESIKYDSFSKALREQVFRMAIDAQMARN
jgi:hypothetical protein